MQIEGDAEAHMHVANHLSSFRNNVGDIDDEVRSSLDEVRQSENLGDKQVHLKIDDLKAQTDAATKKFMREASQQLELEAQVRKAEDEKLIVGTTDTANIERNEIETNHQALHEQLDIIHETRDAKIKEAKREHEIEVAALHEAGGELATAIVTRVDAAETRIRGQERDQSDRVSKLLHVAKQKSAAADARAAELLKSLQEQSNAILGVGNPSTAACEAATIGLCNVRDQLHGGVAGTCDPARSSGGWCSFRCNNGMFRGEDGCKAK